MRREELGVEVRSGVAESSGVERCGMDEKQQTNAESIRCVEESRRSNDAAIKKGAASKSAALLREQTSKVEAA